MKVQIKKLKKFDVTGGLGRLCQFPKTVTVAATDEDDAMSMAMNQIRRLITDEDFGGDKTKPMLSKLIHFSDVVEA